MGFHFKDTNEYGLFGLCVADKDDRVFEGFYRSAKDFETEEYLHGLVTDYEIWALARSRDQAEDQALREQGALP